MYLQINKTKINNQTNTFYISYMTQYTTKILSLFTHLYCNLNAQSKVSTESIGGTLSTIGLLQGICVVVVISPLVVFHHSKFIAEVHRSSKYTIPS